MVRRTTGAAPAPAQRIAAAAGSGLPLIVVVFFGWLFLAGACNPAERRRLYAIAVLLVASAIFWSEFEQAGSTLNLFADRATRTSILGWEFPSSYFQSLQPLFIITFAPVFAWVWIRLGSPEPSSPAKFGLGLLFVGAGFAILVVAAQLAEAGVKVAPWWLVVTYLLHTFCELSLSPVGLSATTKLAPARVVGLMMGVFYLAISVGNFIGGGPSSLYVSLPLPQRFVARAAGGMAVAPVEVSPAP